MAANSPGTPRMLLTTTDTLPQEYEVLGIVHVAFASRAITGMHLKASANVDEKLSHMYGQLAQRAAAMGANGVIGIRLGQVIGDVQVLLGTAIRRHIE